MNIHAAVPVQNTLQAGMEVKCINTLDNHTVDKWYKILRIEPSDGYVSIEADNNKTVYVGPERINYAFDVHNQRMPEQKVELKPGMIATICRNTYNHEFVVGQDVRLLTPLCGGGWTCESLDSVNKWSVGGKDIENPRHSEKDEKEADGWIVVEDEPKAKRPFLTYSLKSGYNIAHFESGYWYEQKHGYMVDPILYMELPSPPTKS